MDFYWNQNDYTEKYCQVLDKGITQCRASCYLDNLLEKKHKEPSEALINSQQKVKVVEITTEYMKNKYYFPDNFNAM